MPTRLLTVDAFTDTAFSGNPAAVALFDSEPPAATMQAIAAELNLSETAFPTRRDDGAWNLRWFTPLAEVDLCGHATLASAHVLFTEGLHEGPVTFHSRSGPLVCRADDGITMNFPAARATPAEAVPGLAAALGAEVQTVALSYDIMAVLESPEAVRELSPDLEAVAALDTRAVVVTSAGDVDGGDAHFVSRVFAPRVGIPEDPVTGSAHCITGPYWAAELGINPLRAHQVSARGGRLRVNVVGDRVELTGRATTVLDAKLMV